MLQVDGVPLLERILDQVLQLTAGEVVVVTGYRAEQVEQLVANRYAGRVSRIHNPRFQQDTNILSVALGVKRLARPDLGYTIIETDLLIESVGWESIFDGHRGDDSFWVTHGKYGPDLTGGIVHLGADGWIDAIDYRPDHDPVFDGWAKMLGILSVSAECVAHDVELREQAMEVSIQQYYLTPWIDHLGRLPCRALDLEGCLARSFNTPESFSVACRAFLAAARPAPTCG